MTRDLLPYPPKNTREDPPRRPTNDPADRMDVALDTIVPAESNLPYDIKDVIHRVVDDGDFFEVHEHWAKNIVVGFGRMDGRTVGIVGNPAAVLARRIAYTTSYAAEKHTAPAVRRPFAGRRTTSSASAWPTRSSPPSAAMWTTSSRPARLARASSAQCACWRTRSIRCPARSMAIYLY